MKVPYTSESTTIKHNLHYKSGLILLYNSQICLNGVDSSIKWPQRGITLKKKGNKGNKKKTPLPNASFSQKAKHAKNRPFYFNGTCLPSWLA
jgi:hypothetical protein